MGIRSTWSPKSRRRRPLRFPQIYRGRWGKPALPVPVTTSAIAIIGRNPRTYLLRSPVRHARTAERMPAGQRLCCEEDLVADTATMLSENASTKYRKQTNVQVSSVKATSSVHALRSKARESTFVKIQTEHPRRRDPRTCGGWHRRRCRGSRRRFLIQIRVGNMQCWLIL